MKLRKDKGLLNDVSPLEKQPEYLNVMTISSLTKTKLIPTFLVVVPCVK